MPQQPFTPAGVAAKQAELNQLPQAQLTAQANLIRNNLPSWVINNFTLSQTQQTYINSLDSRFTVLAAALTGFAVENKLTVSLAQPTGDGQLKLMHIGNDILCTASPNSFTPSGSLTFQEQYQ